MTLLRRDRTSLVLAVLAVAGLVEDAYVHLHLAPAYDAVGRAVTQGALFRLEAVLALVAAVALLLSDRRPAWALAGLVGLGGATAVVLYRYVDVGPVGPVPDMYEPVWFRLKSWSAGAEAGVAALWVVRELLRRRRTPGAARPSATAASTAG